MRYVGLVSFIFMRPQWRTETDRRKKKLSMVKCQQCGLFVACGHIYASWCHPTAVCLGGSTHTPTHRPSYSCLLPPAYWLSPFCLKVLSGFTGTKSLLALLSFSLHTGLSTCSFRYLTFTQCFTGFTHILTQRSGFFLFSSFLLIKFTFRLRFWTFLIT